MGKFLLLGLLALVYLCAAEEPQNHAIVPLVKLSEEKVELKPAESAARFQLGDALNLKPLDLSPIEPIFPKLPFMVPLLKNPFGESDQSAPKSDAASNNNNNNNNQQEPPVVVINSQQEQPSDLNDKIGVDEVKEVHDSVPMEKIQESAPVIEQQELPPQMFGKPGILTILVMRKHRVDSDGIPMPDDSSMPEQLNQISSINSLLSKLMFMNMIPSRFAEMLRPRTDSNLEQFESKKFVHILGGETDPDSIRFRARDSDSDSESNEKNLSSEEEEEDQRSVDSARPLNSIFSFLHNRHHMTSMNEDTAANTNSQQQQQQHRKCFFFHMIHSSSRVYRGVAHLLLASSLLLLALLVFAMTMRTLRRRRMMRLHQLVMHNDSDTDMSSNKLAFVSENAAAAAAEKSAYAPPPPPAYSQVDPSRVRVLRVKSSLFNSLAAAYKNRYARLGLAPLRETTFRRADAEERRSVSSLPAYDESLMKKSADQN